MNELVEFLEACIAEDKARLQPPPTLGHGPAGLHWPDCDLLWVAEWQDPACTCGGLARGLAECEAKRSIIALHPLAEGPTYRETDPPLDHLGATRAHHGPR
jgi:hypothetical protein